MKHLFLIGSILVGSVAFAASTLKCGALEDVTGKEIPMAPSYSVTKAKSSYALVEKSSDGTFQVYKLTPAGDGDEGDSANSKYSDYNVVDPKNTSLVMGVSIQEKFKWATLVNRNGEGVNKCR